MNQGYVTWFTNETCVRHKVRKRDMLYIIVHGSDVVAVMTSPVDAHLIAKPLGAQIWTCQPNSTDATLLVGGE